ncbi:MAG TPA: 2-dehydro-3-deoxyphosphogluconate aldolase, partial [Candidatus Angelobacter sp.]|nr:2-dehydro-3-deoxyphosphogluconate aldolase [Candidatus Angelobacter sp.]
MTKREVCECISKTGIIPAVRVQSTEDAHFAAECVIDAGIPIVEITMTVPEAVQLIAQLASRHPQLAVGAGTVLDTETARRCVDAGAKFLTAPGFDASLIEFAARQGIAVLPRAHA